MPNDTSKLFFTQKWKDVETINKQQGGITSSGRLSFHLNTIFGYMKQKTAMKQLTSINRCFENFMNQNQQK